MTEITPAIIDGLASAGSTWRSLMERPLGEGVLGYSDMLVTTSGAGLAVSVAAGTGYVRGDNSTDQGLYRVRNDAAKDSSSFVLGGVGTADATNPRIDQVIARIYDDAADASGQRAFQLEILPGTATAGATLDNRTGAANLPSNAMLVADILVPAAFTGPFVNATHIRDRRTFSAHIVPPLLTAVDQVPLIPISPVEPIVTAAHASHDLYQTAVAVYLPRRIVAPSRIRWKYVQGATAMTGNYIFGLYDASGRQIQISTPSAWAGAANSVQVRSEILPGLPSALEGGMYYLMFGNDSGAGGCSFQGVDPQGNAGTPFRAGAFAPNLAARSVTGGITPPGTLAAYTDVGAAAGATVALPVPFVSLSVG